jgi:hypothetical protein
MSSNAAATHSWTPTMAGNLCLRKTAWWGTSSGLFALNREISVCAGLRVAGKTRTSNQTIISR